MNNETQALHERENNLLPDGYFHYEPGSESFDVRKRDRIPRILITATLRWPVAARLTIAFSDIGCHVEAICPRQHPLSKTRSIRHIYTHSFIRPIASLQTAIIHSDPDIIIPCDDGAAEQLHQLYAQSKTNSKEERALHHKIHYSIGNPDAIQIANQRARLMGMAVECGIRVPKYATATTQKELHAWLTQNGFPAVMKTDSTWGGQGVCIVHNHSEAQLAFAKMTSRPAITQSIVRGLLDRDTARYLKPFKKVQRSITLQSFIQGIPSNRAVASWKGKVLSGISVETVVTQHPTGPGTVMRVSNHPEMTASADRLIQRLGVSGLWGVDFILETKTGSAYLIEVNPRATPICHLPLGTGKNLPASIYTQLTGNPPALLPECIDHNIIAMFPGEWQRNPASPYLRSDYHDIPWGETALIQDGIAGPWNKRGLLARLWERLHTKQAAALWDRRRHT